MDAASRKFAELEKREARLGEREATAEQAAAAARQREEGVQDREAAAGVREAFVAGGSASGRGSRPASESPAWLLLALGMAGRRRDPFTCWWESSTVAGRRQHPVVSVPRAAAACRARA